MVRRVALLALAALLFAGVAAGKFCIGKHERSKTIDVNDFVVISFNRLDNVHLVFSEKDGPVQLKMYGNEEFGSVEDYVTVAKDTKKKLLMLDAVDYPSACLYVIVPQSQYLRAITAEGQATITVGPMNVTEFGFVVNNGVIKSSSPIYADALELVVKGNGEVLFNPTESSVGSIYSSIVGKGNVTFTGEADAVEVQNMGTGNTLFGTVYESMDVKLAGSGNTTVIGHPDLVVRGVSMPINHIKVVSGECKVTSEDTNFVPCASVDTALALAG